MTYKTVQVLGGAYRGGRASLAKMLTHTGVGDGNFDEPDAILCKRIPPSHATAWAGDSSEPPTCPVCLRRDPRFAAQNPSVSDDPRKWAGLTASWRRIERGLSRRHLRSRGFSLHWRPIDDETAQIWAVSDDDEVVGSLFYGLEYPGAKAMKGAVEVHPAYRRRGVATAMYAWGEELPVQPGLRFAPDEPHTEDAAAFWRSFGSRRNSSQLRSAENLYETFHQFEPEDVGSMPNLRIPREVTHVGEAKVMYYASDKLNPDTSEDEGWIHYFHEHEGGVKFCVTDDEDEGKTVEVPNWVRSVNALTRIGDCEGFEYEDFDGKTVEAEGTGRLPEWYATPDGRALLIVQDKRRVIAILWGGSLDVRAEGVVG